MLQSVIDQAQKLAALGSNQSYTAEQQQQVEKLKRVVDNLLMAQHYSLYFHINETITSEGAVNVTELEHLNQEVSAVYIE
jgi:hypothetical protein